MSQKHANSDSHSSTDTPTKTKVHVQQREHISYDLRLREFPWKERQKDFLKLAQDKETKLLLCKGPAGTAKTMMAVYCALKALKEKTIREIIYIRNPVESSSFSLGFLKGNLEEKMSPYLQPMMEKLNELLPQSEVARLLKDSRVTGVPLGFLRGLTFNSSYVIVDEAQNLKREDLLLIMTRLGKFSKLIICGDVMQSDIRNGSFEKVYSLFDDSLAREKGIHTIKFNINDIVRNPILSFIIERFDPIQAYQ